MGHEIRPREHCTCQRKFLLAAGVIFLLAILGGVLYGTGIVNRSTLRQAALTVETAAVPEKELTLDEKVDKIVSEMTPAEKIGQMMMIGIKGTEVNDDSLYMLHEYHMGGIILFDRNMESQEQVTKLIGSMQKQADQKLPLFIALDEEGGDVVRMKKALPPPPSQKKIGQEGDPEAAEK